jgi:broad specificity phosphatase PhoE
VTQPTDTIRPDDASAPVSVAAAADPYSPSSLVEPAAVVKPGAITLVRHGEPGLSRKVTLNAAEYVDWWARYEETGLLAGQTPPESLVALVRDADVVISSTRIRAIETARAVSGNRPFDMDPTLIEAPLPPPMWPSWLRFSPRRWGVVARIWWWFFNHHNPGQESRAEAERRADLVAGRLAAIALAGEDVVVLAHGFFNTMIGFSLKRLGWKLVDDQGWRYWCARRFERR